MRKTAAVLYLLLVLGGGLVAQDILSIFPWLTEVKTSDHQSFFVDTGRSAIDARRTNEGTSIGKVFVGNNIPLAEVSVRPGMYDDTSVEFDFSIAGKPAIAYFSGVLRKIIVPGTGVVYTVESSRSASSSLQLRKFVWKQNSFKEIEQAFNYYGADHIGLTDHIARRDLTIYADAALTKEVGTLSEGSKAYIIGWKSRIDSLGEKPKTSMLVLVRTPLGLVGWCGLENYYGSSSDIAGFGSTP